VTPLNLGFRFPPQLAATVLLLTGTLAASKLMAHRKSEMLARPLETISRNMAGFSGADNPALDEGTLRTLNPTSYLSRTYSRDSLKADLFIAFYAQQRAGESMHSPKHCLPGSGWEIWNYDTMEVPAAGQRFTVNKYSISRESERRLVLYWYQSRDRIIASEYLGKLLLARDTLLQNATAASIVRVILPDQPGAPEIARAFASELIPQVQVCFGR
jgi:EpsI family protein